MFVDGFSRERGRPARLGVLTAESDADETSALPAQSPHLESPSAAERDFEAGPVTRLPGPKQKRHVQQEKDCLGASRFLCALAARILP
jgi:hypothetical protein